MSGQHTPGPWYVMECDDDGAPSFEIGSDDTHPIATVAHTHPDLWGRSSTHNAELTANARLIAAAPDLLAICVEFVRRVEAGEVRSKRTYAAMKAAIAKAGQS